MFAFLIGPTEILVLAVLCGIPLLAVIVLLVLLAARKPNPNLTRCPDCGRMVSLRAPACPGCGAPFSHSAEQ